jgi:hypothetical protein
MPLELLKPTVDKFGNCECDKWGMVGTRPNVRFCTCPVGDSLQRDIVTWDRRTASDKRDPITGNQLWEMTKWTTDEWLQFSNAMPRPQVGRHGSETNPLAILYARRRDELREELISGALDSIDPQTRPTADDEYQGEF